MEMKKVWAVYFSATGTTKKVVQALAEQIACEMRLAWETFDFTLPTARENMPSVAAKDVVVFGMPVYAGRVPNLMLNYLTGVKGNGALCIPIVLYGNRDFDDALLELKDILRGNGFLPVAAAAFVGEHAFSNILAKGRPDDRDMEDVANFAHAAAGKIMGLRSAAEIDVMVDGTPYPYRGYFKPRDHAGNPIDIRKVFPRTREACDDCKLCADICPMGAIDDEDVRAYTGICIKCGACVKRCPRKAKYYDDEGYLNHKQELEETLVLRAESKTFL